MTSTPDFPIRLGRRQVVAAAGALVAVPAVAAFAAGAPSRQATPGATPGTPGATPAGTPGAAAVVTVEAYEFGFRPNAFTIAAGDTVAFYSSGQYPHDFKIDGIDSVDVDFPEDGSTIDWTAPAELVPGSYTFYCSKPGHREQGMEGQLTVTAAAKQSVVAFEFGYEPNEFTVTAGETISFSSRGQYPHDFKIDGVDSVDVDFPEDGSAIDWAVPADLAPGEYTFYCSKPGHREQGMEGRLTVNA